MAEYYNRATMPRSGRRSSGEATQDCKGINGDDGTAKGQAKRNYKLLIDPAIKKGHHKIYRFDGVLPGQPPVIPRDPRPPKTKLWTASVADIPIPRFKVDKNYVGPLPENTIKFGCLNDNVNRQFLKELCSKFGKIEECKVYYDIKSKKHLGTGKITFSSSSAARQAISELDGSSVMGNIIRVSIDRKKPSHSNHLGNKQGSGSKDPREYKDPRRSSTGSVQPCLPTPSPSQYSPSVDSTPPTPFISGLSRIHPVAELKNTSYVRKASSLDSDGVCNHSPASICSASFNSGTFEPISPPPMSRLRSSSLDTNTLPPPPPPAPFSSKNKTSNQPPPPPPANQEIYEDISPTASFEEEKTSSTTDNISHIEKTNETFVQSHLLGLQFARQKNGSSEYKTINKVITTESACTESSSKVKDNDKKHHNNNYRNRRDRKSPRREDYQAKEGSKRKEISVSKNSLCSYDGDENRRDKKINSPYYRDNSVGKSPSQEASISQLHQANRGHSNHSPEVGSPLARPGFEQSDTKQNNAIMQSKTYQTKTTLESPINDSVYEEISDSDDDMKCSSNTLGNNKNLQIEDISPAGSPVRKNGPVLVPGTPSESNNSLSNDKKCDTMTEQVEMDIDKDDDDDDAMSLSSISSNEDTALVLNAPYTKLPVQVSAISSHAVTGTAYQQISYSTPIQFVPPRPQVNVPPPVNIAVPPPVNVAVPPPVNVAAAPPVNVAAPPPVNVGGPPPVNVAAPPPMNIGAPPPVNVAAPPAVNVAAPPPVNLPPHSTVNIPNRILPNIPPPPPVNIHVPPPGIPFNKHVPPPFSHPPVQHPPLSSSQPSQPPLATFPQRPVAGGFIGSFPRPYSGFYPGEYQKYPTYSINRERPTVIETPRKVPYKEKVTNACSIVTKKDLKSVLHRDLIKKLVEHSGFSAFEAWWDNQTKSKEPASHAKKPSTFDQSYVSPLTPSNISSPASSTATSSLLSSLFGRASSGTGLHGTVQKIPSFRISRKPQTKPVAREPNNKWLKRTNSEKLQAVMNKVQRVEQSDDEEDQDDESEASDSDSEVERSLLASQRTGYKSGSSLYRSIYESSSEEEKEKDEDEEEEDEDEKSEESDDEDERSELSQEDQEELSDEEELTHERLKSEKLKPDLEDEGDEDEAESSEEESSESEWESSDAGEAVQEVIDETKQRLDQYKEKSSKRQAQEEAIKQHDKLVEEYLQRISNRETIVKPTQNEQIVKKPEPAYEILEEKVSLKTLNNQKVKDVELLENETLDENVKHMKMSDSIRKDSFGYVNNSLIAQERDMSVVFERPIVEESEVVAEVDETESEILNGMEAGVIEEELISEEIIKVEPEDKVQEELFNEHSYAYFTPLENKKIEAENSLTERFPKEPDRESPIIDVVKLVDEESIKPAYLKAEPKIVFPMRSIEEENSLVWNIFQYGIDNEDLKYLKSAYDSLKLFGSDVVNGLHWSSHPETFLYTKQKRYKNETSLGSHKTGCARSEGYYKIPMSEKALYLSHVRRQEVLKEKEEEKETDGLKHKQQSRENRAMQRRLISSFVNDDFGDLVKFNKLKARKKHLKFSKSGIHNWGLFTCEPIAAEEMVVEYVGEMVRSIIADAREKHYEQIGIGSSYLFRLDADTVIDATKVGNNARFINHSCAPNCYAKIINVENEKKIVIYSKCDIKTNEEITYDYKFPIEDVKIQCLCGTPQCRGTLN